MKMDKDCFDVMTCSESALTKEKLRSEMECIEATGKTLYGLITANWIYTIDRGQFVAHQRTNSPKANHGYLADGEVVSSF